MDWFRVHESKLCGLSAHNTLRGLGIKKTVLEMLCTALSQLKTFSHVFSKTSLHTCDESALHTRVVLQHFKESSSFSVLMGKGKTNKKCVSLEIISFWRLFGTSWILLSTWMAMGEEVPSPWKIWG